MWLARVGISVCQWAASTFNKTVLLDQHIQLDFTALYGLSLQGGCQQ